MASLLFWKRRRAQDARRQSDDVRKEGDVLQQQVRKHQRDLQNFLKTIDSLQ